MTILLAFAFVVSMVQLRFSLAQRERTSELEDERRTFCSHRAAAIDDLVRNYAIKQPMRAAYMWREMDPATLKLCLGDPEPFSRIGACVLGTDEEECYPALANMLRQHYQQAWSIE